MGDHVGILSVVLFFLGVLSLFYSKEVKYHHVGRLVSWGWSGWVAGATTPVHLAGPAQTFAKDNVMMRSYFWLDLVLLVTIVTLVTFRLRATNHLSNTYHQCWCSDWSHESHEKREGGWGGDGGRFFVLLSLLQSQLSPYWTIYCKTNNLLHSSWVYTMQFSFQSPLS